MFEKAVLSVEDPQGFALVRQAIETAYSSSNVAGFLKSIEKAGLRIRSFETVLQAKLFGEPITSEYAKLGNSDQGQIRELYLASLEKVAPDLRQKFFKLYAYY